MRSSTSASAPAALGGTARATGTPGRWPRGTSACLRRRGLRPGLGVRKLGVGNGRDRRIRRRGEGRCRRQGEGGLAEAPGRRGPHRAPHAAGRSSNAGLAAKQPEAALHTSLQMLCNDDHARGFPTVLTHF